MGKIVEDKTTPWTPVKNGLPTKDCEVLANIIHYYKDVGGIKEISSRCVLEYKKKRKLFIDNAHDVFYRELDDFIMTGFTEDMFKTVPKPKLTEYLIITAPEDKDGK